MRVQRAGALSISFSLWTLSDYFTARYGAASSSYILVCRVHLLFLLYCSISFFSSWYSLAHTHTSQLFSYLNDPHSCSSRFTLPSHSWFIHPPFLSLSFLIQLLQLIYLLLRCTMLIYAPCALFLLSYLLPTLLQDAAALSYYHYCLGFLSCFIFSFFFLFLPRANATDAALCNAFFTSVFIFPPSSVAPRLISPLKSPWNTSRVYNIHAVIPTRENQIITPLGVRPCNYNAQNLPSAFLLKNWRGFFYTTSEFLYLVEKIN